MMLRRLIPYWRPARRDTLAGAALLALAACLELAQPWPIKWLMDYVFAAHTPPASLARAWPSFASHDAVGGIYGACLAILVFATAYRAAHTLSQWLLIRAGAQVAAELRCGLADRLNRLPLRYHDRARVGDSLYRAAYDTQAAQSLLSGAIVPIVTGALILAGILAVMSRMDMALTLVAVAMLPAFWAIIHLFGSATERRSGSYHESQSRLVAQLQENLSSIRAVQAYTHEDVADREFRTLSRDCLRANMALTGRQLAFSATVGLAMAVGTAAVVGFGAERVLSGRLLPGDVLVFLAYLGMLYQPMSAFTQSASVARSSRAQLDRVFTILDEPNGLQELPDALAPATVTGCIAFHEVDFEYDPGSPVLHGIDFVVQPGTVTALVGRTGAGKSTVAMLLMRFFDPTRGSITLDGANLRNLSVRWLRRNVAFVLQDSILFAATIRENIAYGRARATDAEVEEAARQAQAHEFIAALPLGYETVLGERGVNLSGGQRQRLAIARAFVKNAPILILDEPTASLDGHTENALLEAMQRLMHGRTTIIIAHRLSTIRGADLILVMEDGRIIERGTHESLMARDTRYRSMVAARDGRKAQREPVIELMETN